MLFLGSGRRRSTDNSSLLHKNVEELAVQHQVSLIYFYLCKTIFRVMYMSFCLFDLFHTSVNILSITCLNEILCHVYLHLAAIGVFPDSFGGVIRYQPIE